MAEFNQIGLGSEQEAFNSLGRALYGLLTPGSTRVEFESNVLRGTSSTRVRVFSPSGQLSLESMGERYSSPGSSWEIDDLAEALRDACYREGKGTWFSVKIVVHATGSARAEYNYDLEPEVFPGDAAPDPAAYVEDQEFFPRDISAQPEWLRQRLAEGQAHIEASGNRRRRQ
ncbi:hypothetical protein [Mycetocola saprophilus]|uniref:hypothetical protein n=1 Tax=Mycetocola saprophilus TaxID=76636 RepID=UPI003BF09512